MNFYSLITSNNNFHFDHTEFLAYLSYNFIHRLNQIMIIIIFSKLINVNAAFGEDYSPFTESYL